ncbi:PLP-dependent decarboxylase [Ideonella sp.]|uniref:PLP-dependent decarboxylase n=1 Tax=Ideonella sp. TaxID=1929293 RepID=UPI0035B1B355
MASTLSSVALRDADTEALAALETPCYVFDPATVIEDHARLRAELGTPVVVSMKANPVLDLLVRCNHAFTDGIEIASLGELNVTVGRMTVPRYVNTPALDATLAAAALACRATLIIDGPQQLALVREVAAKARGPLRIGLRINAGALLESPERQRDHFGMDLDTLWSMLDALKDDPLKIAGLHVFAGSNSFGDCAVPIAERMANLVADVRGHAGAALEFVNLGGGIPANWREAGLDFAPYRAALARLQQQPVTVMHEAGRAVFSRGGAFLTRVLATRSVGGRAVAVCDGGMAQCFALAQTENFVKKPAQPRRVPLAAEADASVPAGPTLLVGSSCNKADRIGQLDGEPANVGDLLVFDHCGAYHSYSPTGFLNLRGAQRYIAS